MRPCSKLTYFQTKKNISTLTWSVCQFAYGYFIFCLNLHAGLYYTMCPTRLLLHAIWFSSLMAYFFKSVLCTVCNRCFKQTVTHTEGDSELTTTPNEGTSNNMIHPFVLSFFFSPAVLLFTSKICFWYVGLYWKLVLPYHNMLVCCWEILVPKH